MSQENVEIVRKVFEAGETEAMLEFLPEDVVWHAFPGIGAEKFRGYDGIREIMEVWTESFDDFTVETPELREAGHRVVALAVQGGMIKGSAARISQPVGAVFSDFRDAKTGKAWFFQSWREALETAGLKE